MSCYVGLDVSVKSVSICVVNEKGSILARGETLSDPDKIAHFIQEHAPNPKRVVHESGILAIWLTRELEKRGLPIICIDARLAHKALSGRINKTDPGDAARRRPRPTPRTHPLRLNRRHHRRPDRRQTLPPKRPPFRVVHLRLGP